MLNNPKGHFAWRDAGCWELSRRSLPRSVAGVHRPTGFRAWDLFLRTRGGDRRWML